MKYTLLLCGIILFIYFILASAFFIPDELIGVLSFSVDNILGIFTYSFVHIGLQHMLGNIFLLIPVGIIVEQNLGRKHLLAIYFLSGITAAALFVAIMPNAAPVGASAAVAGLVIPACLIDFKKTIFYIAVFTVVAIVLINGVNFLITQSYLQAKQKTTVLQEDLNKTTIEKNKTTAQIVEIEIKYGKGELPYEEYVASKQNLTEKIQTLEKEANETKIELNKTAGFAGAVKYGIDREKATQTSLLVHVIGSLIGLAYLCAFRRDIVLNSGYQIIKFQRWLKRQRRKLSSHKKTKN
jgi:membrane associated rhomboid family serine protease